MIICKHPGEESEIYIWSNSGKTASSRGEHSELDPRVDSGRVAPRLSSRGHWAVPAGLEGDVCGTSDTEGEGQTEE